MRSLLIVFMAPHRRRPSPNRGVKIGLSIFAVIALLGFYILASLGPGTSRRAPVQTTVSEEVLEIKLESEQLESRFMDIVNNRLPTDDDMSLLERAIRLHESYRDALPSRDTVAEARAERLRRLFEEHRGGILWREAVRLEEEAAAAESVNPDQALTLYRTALSIREDIRARFSSSSYNRSNEFTRLQRKVQHMDTVPIFRQSEQAERDARSALEAGNRERAIELLRMAISRQEEINRSAPSLSLANPLRASQLRDELAAIESSDLQRDIVNFTAEAEKLVEQGDHVRAAGAFSRAREAQARLNREFPRSPHASDAKLRSLVTREQNANGFADYLSIIEMDERVRRLLFEGRVAQALVSVEELATLLNRFEVRYPQSSLPLREIREKNAYFRFNRDNLERIHLTLSAALRDIPAPQGWQMLETEVDQLLFQMVMGNNPSRQQGDSLPVESVAVTDIRAFLQRTGWILARYCRLPTVDEFVALADAESGTIWHLGNSASEARAVNSGESNKLGFYHLIGNIAEVVTDTSGNQYFQIGGHARMTVEDSTSLRPARILIHDRNRMVGFRFMASMEVDLSGINRQPEI